MKKMDKNSLKYLNNSLPNFYMKEQFQMNQAHEELLQDKEFMIRFAKEFAKYLSHEPGEHVKETGINQYATPYQLDRFKKCFIFLLNTDGEMKSAIRQKLRNEQRKMQKIEELSKRQIIYRIKQFTPNYIIYRGKACGVFCDELTDIFPEYTTQQRNRILKEKGVFIRSSQRKDPRTRTYKRCAILDLDESKES